MSAHAVVVELSGADLPGAKLPGPDLPEADLFSSHISTYQKSVIAAVSGGSDSLALLFMLHAYLQSRPNRPELPELIAVTVDHDLRAKSALEACAVGALCAAHGIRHHIARWDGEKPETGIPAAARTARYRLLVEAARAHGAHTIFTGHTQDDQIETFLMRKARSPQGGLLRGLAGMAEVTQLERDFRLVRPLLTTTRQTLRAQLEARGIDWIDDPTNVDINYERPRIRQQIAQDGDRAAILADIAQATQRRLMQNAGIVEALQARPRGIVVLAGDAIGIEQEMLSAMPTEQAMLLVSTLVAIMGGSRFLPSDKHQHRLQNCLLGKRSSDKRVGLGGCVIERQQGDDGYHTLWREQRNLADIHIAPQQAAFWDGRFRFFNAGDSVLRIRCADDVELKAFAKSQMIDLKGWHRAALRAAPVILRPTILDDEQIVAVPALCDGALSNGALDTRQIESTDMHVERHFALFDHVLSGHDFGLADVLRSCFSSSTGKTCKPV